MSGLLVPPQRAIPATNLPHVEHLRCDEDAAPRLVMRARGYVDHAAVSGSRSSVHQRRLPRVGGDPSHTAAASSRAVSRRTVPNEDVTRDCADPGARAVTSHRPSRRSAARRRTRRRRRRTTLVPRVGPRRRHRDVRLQVGAVDDGTLEATRVEARSRRAGTSPTDDPGVGVYLRRRDQERVSKLGGCGGVERPDAARLRLRATGVEAAGFTPRRGRAIIVD